MLRMSAQDVSARRQQDHQSAMPRAEFLNMAGNSYHAYEEYPALPDCFCCGVVAKYGQPQAWDFYYTYDGSRKYFFLCPACHDKRTACVFSRIIDAAAEAKSKPAPPTRPPEMSPEVAESRHHDGDLVVFHGSQIPLPPERPCPRVDLVTSSQAQPLHANSRRAERRQLRVTWNPWVSVEESEEDLRERLEVERRVERNLLGGSWNPWVNAEENTYSMEQMIREYDDHAEMQANSSHESDYVQEEIERSSECLTGLSHLNSSSSQEVSASKEMAGCFS